MRRVKWYFILFLSLTLSLWGLSSMAEESTQQHSNPIVVIETNMGNITVELNEAKAPITVKNFLAYVHKDFYDDTIFHRVIKNFMIQGGGYTEDYDRKDTLAPIQNEADNGLENNKGTIAMARTNDPNSASSQFFINLKDNHFLDFKSKTPQGWGYAVFGKVIKGMDVVEKIGALQTGSAGPFASDVPEQPVIIKKVVLENAHAESE